MKIAQEKEFKPLTITIESEGEYTAFVQIIDEVNRIDSDEREMMEYDAGLMAVQLSNWFSRND